MANKPEEAGLLACPICHRKLSYKGEAKCKRCQRTYPLKDGVLDFTVGEDEVAAANVRYYDETADKYDSKIAAQEIYNPNAQGRISEALADIAGERGSGVLLDLGCGTGNILDKAGQHFNVCVGFDVSSKMLAHCRKNGFRVHRANITKLPVRDGCADAVTCYSVLHHIQDPAPVFAEAYRVLKPGGYLYADNDPNASPKSILEGSLIYGLLRNVYRSVFEGREGELGRVDRQTREKAEYHHYHTDGFDPRILGGRLRQAGFTEVKVTAHGNPRSMRDNKFMKCPWQYKIYMTLAAAYGFTLDYQRLAPQLMVLAKK